MAERGRPRSFDRDAALRQAMQLFWEKGYDGASLAELTRAMGINAPSLYAAFGCKEALFREAAELYAATEGAEGGRILAETADTRDAIEGLLRATARICKATPGRSVGCFIALAAPDPTPENAALCRDLKALRQVRMREIRDRLARGVAEGDLPKKTDIDAMAIFYTTIIQGMSQQARDGLDCVGLDALVASAMSAWDALTAARAPGASTRGTRARGTSSGTGTGKSGNETAGNAGASSTRTGRIAGSSAS